LVKCLLPVHESRRNVISSKTIFLVLSSILLDLKTID
jgi:hypothetical protein